MRPGASSRLDTADLTLSTNLFKQRLADTISYARSQKRESWWYSPWTDALNYLCLATSAGVTGSGIYDTERERSADFYLCPQKELLRDVLRSQISMLPSFLSTLELNLPYSPLRFYRGWWKSCNGQAEYVQRCRPTPILTVPPDEILSWSAQTEDLPEETPPTDMDFAGINPGVELESEEDDLMEHPSFARTDNSDTKLEENIRQPDFVILAKAVDTPLHCHSVWEVKTLYSYPSGVLIKGVFCVPSLGYISH